MIPPKYETARKPTPAESKRAYELVRERSFGLCEGCGMRPATEMHHRLYRSHGGLDTVENLLHLCGRGNTSGCHGDAHTGTDRYVLGWAVRTGYDPADVWVLYRGNPLILTAEGGLA